MSEQLNKYGSLCSHDFQKSLTNEIELPCIDTPTLTHKISQFGKICNKCTHIIKDSLKYQKNCIVCADTIEQYLLERELCQHQNRQFQDISIKCLNQPTVSHSVPFKTKVCKRCSDKLRASFMNNKVCKVCEGKEDQVIRDMQKAFISPAFSHFKNIISILKEAGASEQVFKNQIEAACKSQPQVQLKQNGLISSKMIQEYNSSDKEEYHQSKRYKLYPKCRKHKDSFILVCNLCLVALLNIDTCAYGCQQQSKVGKVKKDTQIKFSETGFLVPYPQISKDSYYLELFVIKYIEERGRLDRWESTVRKVTPKTNNEAKFIHRFPLYPSAVAVDNRNIVITGGVLGKSFTDMKPTNQAFVLSLSADAKQFQIVEIAAMHESRSGHSLLYHQQRKMIFALGGYVKGVGYSKTTEVYSMADQVWFKLGDLNVERSRSTPVIYKDSVYVFGGLTNNYAVLEAHGERLNYQTREWEKLAYNGYDFPSLTHATASTSLIPFQKKNSILLFGGGNSAESNPLIQSLSISSKEFGLNEDGKYFKLNYARAGSTLGIIGEDIIIILGGLQQHQSLLSIEAVKLRVTETEISPLFVMDEVQVGSYKLILRQNASFAYKKLYDQLQSSGLVNSSKLESEQSLSGAFNSQLLERMYYSVGKNFVWIPL